MRAGAGELDHRKLENYELSMILFLSRLKLLNTACCHPAYAN